MQRDVDSAKTKSFARVHPLSYLLMNVKSLTNFISMAKRSPPLIIHITLSFSFNIVRTCPFGGERSF